MDSLSHIKKDIKNEYRSLKNRLQSIILDNSFLENEVVPCFPNYPIIPNERCGLWYCDPKHFEQTSYFKSTDGHINQWDFSTRRLNFHLLPILAKSNGIIIVDSTRRGKKIPDALSKTIPIWCAVLNCLILEHASNEPIDYEKVLFVPPATVSNSEYHRILEKIEELVWKLKALEVLKPKELYNMTNGKLIRPFWVYPGSSLLHTIVDPFTGEPTGERWSVPENENIIPIILCTVSYQAQDGVDKRRGFIYVQGAADDHELWSCGLEPKTFWENIDYLNDIGKTDAVLKEFVDTLTLEENHEKKASSSIIDIFESLNRVTPEISLGKIIDNCVIDSKLGGELSGKFSLVIILSETIEITKLEEATTKIIKLFKLQSGSKKSSKSLRLQLPEIFDTINPYFQDASNLAKKPILICCNSGNDMSVAVILTILSKKYSEGWQLETSDDLLISKTVIRKHLAKLISSLQGRNVNPSRATLNSINSYLM
ncbi:hypothetical protein KAFR_0B03980 [Kazachstania africana CBS 2517]|uniref:Initiator tRNA phosphoribosyl transferase n=1 Tax=Kazachstania africana (strain ATCC 22294 / BCRC 22015 / CBS 2517 / CECT 1963 / NBRC 1671 / NRRL Y-8276) TaxID=1071382 RepID=H2AQP4_KAZAF|nr:hypothetical protein KAFR_0B03980 [Kazachstania africana CBS 2517]CCF56694.1 hypothetical protein KAFR_0B03980 [Kazachstania africana CBS 2517]